MTSRSTGGEGIGRPPSRSPRRRRRTSASRRRRPRRRRRGRRRRSARGTYGTTFAALVVDVAVDRVRVRVDQELGRVEAQPGLRLVRPVDAVAVALPGPDARQVAVPVERVALGQLDARLCPVVVEEAQLDSFGVLGEEREVRALAVPGRAERERRPGPDRLLSRSRPSAGRHSTGRTSTVTLAKSATSSSSPRRTRSTLPPRRPRSAPRGGSHARVVDQRAVERAQLVVAALGVELRALERLARLRVGHLLARERREPLELAAAALPRRLGDRGVVVVGEKLERRLLAVLLAQEEQRQLRREEDAGRRDAPRRRRQAVAEGAVARPGRGSRSRSRAAPAGVSSYARRQVGHLPVRLVVPVLLAGQQNVQRVVELVGPLRVVAPLARSAGGRRSPSRRSRARAGARHGRGRRARAGRAARSRRRSRASRRGAARRCGSRAPRARRSGSPTRARRGRA